MNEIYSHPGVPLIDHLEAVANACMKLIQDKKLKLNFPPSILAHIMYIAGAFHDFGKATHFFQAYLANPEKKTGWPQTPCTHFSLAGQRCFKEVSCTISR